MIVEWRAVPDWPGYEVSDHGDVRSYKNGRWGVSAVAKPMVGNLHEGEKYRRFILSRQGDGGRPVRRAFRTHELVLLAFVGPRPAGMVTRHLDGDADNNRLTNLRYGTYSENGLDAVEHGDNPAANKTECVRGHTLTPDNVVSDKHHRRRCLQCRVIHNRQSSARRAERAQLAKEQAA